LSSGLWRDVWSLQFDHYGSPPSYYSSNHQPQETGLSNSFTWEKLKTTAVLKMMKMEHDVIPRNFERHRREAITMERLTHSPYVIDLYGYCGNSILTEFAPWDLSHALVLEKEPRNHKTYRAGIAPHRDNDDADNDYVRENGHDATLSLQRRDKMVEEEIERDDIDHKQENHEQSNGVSGRDLVLESRKTRQKANNTMNWTTQQRLDLALQAAKAIQALHQNDIIHSDVTAKQFLIWEKPMVSGDDEDRQQQWPQRNSLQLKINDFNRCRFVPKKSRLDVTSLNEKCTIRIPSAPGK